MDNTTVVKAYDMRRQERRPIEEIWQLIERFILPFGGQFSDQQGSIDWKRREIFDSTGIYANQLLASNIQSSMTNPITNWANYQFSNQRLNKDKMAVQWRQECEYEVMTSIRSGNFNNESGKFYLDLTSFACGTQSQEAQENDEGDLDKIVFDTIAPTECVFDFTLDGYIRNFYRELNWTAEQIYDKFGPEGTPQLIIDQALTPTTSQTKHKIIFYIWKRRLDTKPNTFQILAPEARPYGSKYILYATKEQLGKELGHYEMPISSATWRSVSGSTWGFSPAMVAIWHILTLNQLNELILRAGEKVIDPSILTTNRGVFGDIDLGAGGVTIVTDMNAIQAFESKARFDVSQMNKRDLEQAIKDMFYWDQLQLKDSPAMTAYEVQARIQLMNRLIGPTYGRLQSHYLDPTLERHFKILYRYKKLPEMPPILADLGADLVINYVGPLASAQRMDEVQNLEATMQGIGNIAQIYPEALDKINIDMVVEDYVFAKAVSSRILRTKDEVKKIREGRQAAMEQQSNMEAASVGADIMSKMPQDQGEAA